jgi:hypothetical protein
VKLLVDIDWEDMLAWYIHIQSIPVAYLVDTENVVRAYIAETEVYIYSIDLLLDIKDIDLRNELWRMREVALSYNRMCQAGREFYKCLDEYCETNSESENTNTKYNLEYLV